ncbi:glycosyltransferase [Knoellia sp. S7-12]|uniref:glycosyltransferase n=1 Tax=Knoellia sp. S7-12 TaxID=3126698 RepID=UPI003366BC3D
MSQSGSQGRAIFVYRGQLGIELSRIEFLIDVTCRAFDQVDILHLTPGRGSSADGWTSLTSGREQIRSVQQVPARLRDALRVRRHIEKVVGDDATVVAVGFSVAAFVPTQRCDVWCINGIPEERLLTKNTVASRLATRFAWAAGRRVQARLAIVVSEPMARLIRLRLGDRRIMVVPNTVDTEVFGVRSGSGRTHLTYVGGGSPWQGLERLSLVWRELHELDPDLKFRVISRDPRAAVLLQGLPEKSVEMVASDDPHDVAKWLHEARLGFLYRAPGLVNEVAWPMKFGEYLAAGVPVAVSRCGWDIEHLVRDHGVGVLVNWEESPKSTAERIARFMKSDTPDDYALAAAVRNLATSKWRSNTVHELGHAARTSANGHDVETGCS